MKGATVICQQIFSILALVIFLLKIRLKSASKSSFFRSGVEIRFWSYNFRRRCAQFYCVLQLSLCRSHCNGCVKVASCCGCMRNTIVFCSWISSIVLEWLHEGYEMDLLADLLHFGASDFPSKNPFKKCFKIVFFSATAECFGVFSHSKGFGADRSSSKTHSPKVPRFQVKVPRFPSKGSQVPK